ncbi:MAG: PAS domain S-box protein [Anaerolineaceae bacterium]
MNCHLKQPEKSKFGKIFKARLVIILAFVLIIFTACAPEISQTTKIVRDPQKPIRVVSDNNYPPYVFLDDKGNLQGILVDQWRLWEQKTGRKVKITGMDWSEALSRMEAGEFDVIDTIFYNETRAKLYDFTKPYATLNVPIYFNNKISGITDPASLKGFQVAVKSGDAVIEVLAEEGVTDLKQYPSYEAIIKAAKNNEIIVFSVDEPPAEYFLYQYGIQGRFNKTAPLYSGQFHRAVRKGDTALLKTIQDGFDQITDQEYSAIDGFWFGTPLVNTNDLKIVGIIAGVILAILLVLVIWNRTLQYQVGRKAKELMKQESLFRQLAENIGEVFYMRDRKTWHTIYANPTFERIWMRSRQDLYNDHNLIFNSVHPDDRERVKKAQQDLQDSGKEYAETYRIVRPDGSLRWIKAQMYPVVDEKGVVVRYAGVAEDITERKQAEEILRESEKRYQELLDNLGQGICIINNDNCFSYSNPAGNEIFGVADGELVGQPITSFLLPDMANNLIVENFHEDSGMVLTLEVEIIRKDKVHRIVQVTARPHIDSAGTTKGLICSFLDITEKKQAEKVLRRSEERFRYIFEQAAVGFAQSEADTGKYVRINQKFCDIIGYSRDELLQKTYKEITLPEDLVENEILGDRLLRGEISVFTLEKRFIRKDGEIIWVNLTVSSMWEEGDEPAFNIAVIEDITERKKTEAALEKSTEELILAIEGSGVGIWDLNVETTETSINDRWAEMIGYRKEELVPILKEKFQGLCEPHDLARSSIVMKEMLEGKTEKCEYEMRMLHKDGFWVWMLIHGKVTKRDNKGRPIRVTGTQLDISERKRTEESIREKEFWLRESQRVGRIGSYAFEIQEDRWNSSPVLDDLFGIDDTYPKSTASWNDIIHPDERETMLIYLTQHVLAEGNAFDKEYRIFRISDGEERWVWGRGELVFDDGEAVRMIGTIQDITEQKKADEVLLNTTLEIQTAYEATLQGWSSALEMRERETAGHSQRVVELTLKMARMMNFTDEEIIHVQRGALLHDIGKMGIPDNILLKPSSLSEDEWVIMKQHPIYAYRLLSKIPYLQPALDIPYYHHERFDGSGYPNGLSGEMIPLSARIFAIVDVWDALLSDRPYRPAWTEDAALKYLKDQAGKQFDPVLVIKFCTLVAS